MVSIGFTLVLLFPFVKGFINPKQSSDTGRTITVLPPASKFVTASQTQGVLRPQGLSIAAAHTSSTALSARSDSFAFPSNFNTVESGPVVISPSSSQWNPAIETEPTKLEGLCGICDVDSAANAADVLIPTVAQSSQIPAALPLTSDTSTSSSSIAVGNEGKTATQDPQSQYVEPTPTLEKTPSTTLRRNTAMNGLDLQASSSKKTLTESQSSSVADAKLTALITSSQTITADDQHKHIHSSTTTLGSDTSTITPVLHSSGIQTLRMSNSSTSQLSYVTGTPDFSKISPFLAMSGRSMTANSLSQFSIDGQALTPGGTIILSGTMVSLAPDKSNFVVGTRTQALIGNITSGSVSIPGATGVQTFKGSALGAKDGL